MSKGTFPTYQICGKSGRWLINKSQWANRSTNDNVRSVSVEWRRPYPAERPNLIEKDKSENWRNSSSNAITKDCYASESKIPEIDFETFSGIPCANMNINQNQSLTDQESDMIIMTIGLLKALGLPMNTLTSRGFDGMTMNVADVTSAQLSHYASFELGVLGVWRKVEAFVRPFNKDNCWDIHLLLGMPWLHAVDARIRIRGLIIEISDSAIGEKIMKIKGPKFVESEKHKLVLCPVDSQKLKDQTILYDESSDESDDEGFGIPFQSESSKN
ncbi:hypothetical protein OnM2_025123 [Erysiphe neolycopersici]|uniref:Uncharacterized protein n=1 Tax=Erysiphe neolycopersici TaxID=212602 RepID=A0A420I1B3_9PEZI|nr:hypothetical protein OnM2_025123 [Erysiphe neolycopersici]